MVPGLWQEHALHPGDRGHAACVVAVRAVLSAVPGHAGGLSAPGQCRQVRVLVLRGHVLVAGLVGGGGRAEGGGVQPLVLPVDRGLDSVFVLCVRVGHQDGLGPVRQQGRRQQVPARGDCLLVTGGLTLIPLLILLAWPLLNANNSN